MLSKLNVAVASMAMISSAINLESYHDDDDGTVKDGNNKIKINI